MLSIRPERTCVNFYLRWRYVSTYPLMHAVIIFQGLVVALCVRLLMPSLFEVMNTPGLHAWLLGVYAFSSMRFSYGCLRISGMNVPVRLSRVVLAYGCEPGN